MRPNPRPSDPSPRRHRSRISSSSAARSGGSVCGRSPRRPTSVLHLGRITLDHSSRGRTRSLPRAPLPSHRLCERLLSDRGRSATLRSAARRTGSNSSPSPEARGRRRARRDSQTPPPRGGFSPAPCTRYTPSLRTHTDPGRTCARRVRAPAAAQVVRGGDDGDAIRRHVHPRIRVPRAGKFATSSAGRWLTSRYTHAASRPASTADLISQ